MNIFCSCCPYCLELASTFSVETRKRSVNPIHSSASAAPSRLQRVSKKKEKEKPVRCFCISEFVFFLTPPLPHSSSTAGFTGATEHHLQPAPAAGQQGARHRAQRLPVQEERRVGAHINSHRLQFACFSIYISARNLPGDFCHPARQLKNDLNCCSVGGVNRTLRLVQAFSDSDPTAPQFPTCV